MCGINGALAFTNEGKKFISNIGPATNELKRRGPDGSAVFTNDLLALGHCRLSIIDTSAIANQPMYADNGRYVIVFNGEILNFQELRQSFLKDEMFQTHSDTEVFLKLFIKLKAEAFKLLRGFFAAAIYDHHTNELFLVRDRFGKKPLLYYQSDDALVFASEMKSLFSFGIPKKINWNILPVYLQLNYIPQPYSMIEGVRKLNAGSYLKINGNSVEEHRYYHLETKPSEYNLISYDDAQKKLIELMDESVRLRLIADVPLGAFLSGGIDSSVVVALASQHTKHLSTFSIGYKDHPYFDETKYANLVAKKWDTDHTVFSLSNNDFLEHVFDVLDYIDEPFADSSAIPQFILSHYTRKHVTVALSGDGGDEVFAGYNKHGAEWDIRNQDWKGKAVAALSPIWKTLPKSRSNKITNLFRQLNRYSIASNLSYNERYWQLASFQTKTEAREYLKDDVLSKTDALLPDTIKKQFTSAINGDFNDVLLADMNLVLIGDMLTKVDLMSMANSLEIRSPFLDQEVVDFAFGLPASYKISKGMKKRIVQDAFRSMLPAELYNRPKRGFEIPLLDWLRKELWQTIDGDLLSESFIREQNIFDALAIKNLKSKLKSSNPGDSHAIIWAIIVFQYWWKKYIA
jgi:asparagine synthase (glutamine-hydrolysing)